MALQHSPEQLNYGGLKCIKKIKINKTSEEKNINNKIGYIQLIWRKDELYDEI